MCLPGQTCLTADRRSGYRNPPALAFRRVRVLQEGIALIRLDDRGHFPQAADHGLARAHA
jgi:hypothetical protein